MSNEEVLCLVQEQRSLMQVIKQRQANWIGHALRHDCLLKTTRGEDRGETAKRKTKKEDAGSTYGARGKEDQLRGTEERSTEPGRMAPSSVEPALGQSTQEEEEGLTCKVLYCLTTSL